MEYEEKSKYASFIDSADIERVELIAQHIKEHRYLEDSKNIQNKAVASFKVEINGKHFTLWLVNGEVLSGTREIKDFLGHSAIERSHTTTLNRRGEHRTFSKNSRMAGQIIMAKESSFRFTVNNNENIVILYSRSDFNPFKKNNDASDLTIKLQDRSYFYRYKSLTEILNRIDKKKSEIDEFLKISIYEKDDQLCNDYLEQRRKKEAELEVLIRTKEDFIVAQAKLRYKAILDQDQETIKRNNYYNETVLLIDGGPGTGKTTTLIQRIKFLIDPVVIRENINFFLEEHKQKLQNKNNPAWIFFSPSHLLYLYLKEAMAREGLNATSETGKVWSKYKTNLMWRYDLANKKTKKPFTLDRVNKNRILFFPDGKSINEIIGSFEMFIFREKILEIDKKIEVELDSIGSKNIAVLIKNRLDQSKLDDFNDLLRFYIRIKKQFSEEIGVMSEEIDRVLELATAKLKLKIDENPIILDKLKLIHENTMKSSNYPQRIEDYGGDMIASNYYKFDNWIFRKIKSLFKKQALILYDPAVSMNRLDEEILNIYVGLQNFSQLKKIGEFEYLKNNIFNLAKGIGRNILNIIPSFYIRFRNEVLPTLSDKTVNKNVLMSLLNNDKNRLHVDEQAFLIGFINGILLKFYKIDKTEYLKEKKNKYINAFEEVSKMVIAIDEVSDFHLIDLYCMFSLADKDKSSITLSGDLMQRLTFNGVESWSQLTSITNQLEISKLKTSYRQSPTLLDLATSIYFQSTGAELALKPFLDRNPNEPKILCEISEDEKIKIEWIGQRIIEIYSAYGNMIPSIAIFLSEPDKLDSFAYSLGEIEDLADVDIEVRACKDGQMLGESNTVRVFDLSYIKGLEFEAVIFHNLDSITELGLGKDLILRNLYVGLSRATFYTAITLTNDWTDELRFIKNHIDNNNSWILNDSIFNGIESDD